MKFQKPILNFVRTEGRTMQAHSNIPLQLYRWGINTRFNCCCFIWINNDVTISKKNKYALMPIAASRLLFSSAEVFKKSLWQTVWTQIRLLL